MKHYIKKAALPVLIILVFTAGAIPADTTAENFAVYNIRGDRHIFYKIIDSLPDKALLIVNFTSVNCLPCRKELPELKSISDSTAGKVQLMCIYAEAADTAGESAGPLGVGANTYVDPFGNIQKLYNVKKYPITFVIDKQYRILGRFEGYNEANIKKIKKLCGVL